MRDQNVLAGIRHLAAEKGFITYADLDLLLPAGMTDADELDALYDALAAAGIAVYNSSRDYAHFNRPKKRKRREPGGPRIFRDPVDRYAKQLEKSPRFTAEETGALLNEIAALAETGSNPVLLQEKRNLLVSGYLRLVFAQAARYVNRGIDYIDLVQEGNHALVEAVSRIERHAPPRFTPYITSVIRDAMLTALHRNGSTIRLPLKDEQRLKQLKKEFNRLEQFVEIINHDDIRREKRVRQGEEIRRLTDIKRIRSLSAPVLDGEMGSLSDYIPDENAVPQHDVMTMAQNLELVRELMEDLPGRERDLITVRYGLDGGGYRSLQEAADELNLTAINARNLEERALRRLAEMARNVRGEDG